MSRLDLPEAFGPTTQEKVKSTIVKMAKPPKNGLVDTMKELVKRHLGVTWDLFNTDKLTGTADITARMAAIENEIKAKVSKLTAQAADVNDEVDAVTRGAGKEISADLTALLRKVKSATGPYTAQINALCEGARTELKTMLAKSRAGDKKVAAPTGGPKVETKGQKMIRARGIEVLRKVRNPVPGAKPSRFMVVEFKKVVRVYMGPVAGPAQEKILRALFPNEKPVKIHKDPASEIVWEEKALTLVSDRIPPGLAKKVQIALKVQLKMSLKVRMRKTTGPAEEATDADAKELHDDMLKTDSADKKAAEKAGREFATKLGRLKPEIDKAMKAFDPDDKKALVELIASLKKNGDADKFEDAASDLEEIEAMLDETPSGDVDEEDDGLNAADITKLRDAWVSVKSDALRDIKSVAEAVVALYRSGGSALPAGLPDAVKKLNGCMSELQTDLDKQLSTLLAEKDSGRRAQQAKLAKASAVKLRQFVEKNEIMRELDDNEVLKVKVSGPVKKALANVEAALG